MEEIKNLFDAIKEVCDENDRLHEENKCLKEEINNREIARIECDAYVKKLLKERNKLREEIDNDGEIIQSLHDEIETRCTFTKKVIKERDDFCDEMKLMVKDHEAECDDYKKMLKEKVDMDDIRIIIAEYMTKEFTPKFAKIILFQIMDKIKEYIDGNKKEC